MPIYLDRHEVSDKVTAETIAKLHQEDLKVQDKFNCKGLAYWFDEKRKTAFCLFEAPDKQCIFDFHNYAHKAVPSRIIEIEQEIVESFLAGIDSTETSKNINLNIIHNPGFRSIMAIGLKQMPTNGKDDFHFQSSLDQFNQLISKKLKCFNGKFLKRNRDFSLISFRSVTNAMGCAMAIQSEFRNCAFRKKDKKIELKTGLSAGILSEMETGSEETIKLAERLFYFSKSRIVVSNTVHDLFLSENRQVELKKEFVQILHPDDEKFLNSLMSYIEMNWKKSDLQIDDICKFLGCSKSNLYRKMISLFGKSLNTFVKEYRLNCALSLIDSRKGNISEIAYEAGFNSPSYFSKCFHKKYGIKPSEYLHKTAV